VRMVWWAPAFLLSASCAHAGPQFTGSSRVRPVEVTPCPRGLGQLGLTSLAPSPDVSAIYDPYVDSTIVVFHQAYYRYQRLNQGVNSMRGLMEVGGQPPTALTYLQLDVIVTSLRPRSYSERQLTLVTSDSQRFEIAPTLTAPVRATRADGVVEQITFMLPPGQAIAALRSATVQGTLGATLFRMSDRERDGLRALVMYVQCGSR